MTITHQATPDRIGPLVDLHPDTSDALARVARDISEHFRHGDFGPFHVHLKSTADAVYLWSRYGEDPSEPPTSMWDDVEDPQEWFTKRHTWAMWVTSDMGDAGHPRPARAEQRAAMAVAHLCRALMGGWQTPENEVKAARRSLGLALAAY